eukprot:1160797-Pelagomonas_calceolata.AAC.3
MPAIARVNMFPSIISPWAMPWAGTDPEGESAFECLLLCVPINAMHTLFWLEQPVRGAMPFAVPSVPLSAYA